jgi:hypothetical protein
MVNKIMKNLNTTEYFYIIQHNQSSRKYAGARWAIGCNPSELLTENGYCTSSNTVNKLIESDGLDSFKILTIVTEFEQFDNAYDYETSFLNYHDCANSDEWFNYHNNDLNMAFGTIAFKKMMMDLYGVDHYSQTEEYKIKFTNTCLEKYEVEHYSQTEEYKIKFTNTCLEKYGVIHPMMTPEIFQKLKDTCNIKYGSDCYILSDEYKSTKHECQYCGEIYIGDKGNFTRFHNENCKQNPNRILPPINTCDYCGFENDDYRTFSQYHGENCKHNPNNNIPLFKCEYCNLETMGAANFKRYHGENCKKNPNKVETMVNTNDMILCEYCKRLHSKNTNSTYHGKKCKSNPSYIKPEKIECEFCKMIISEVTYNKTHGFNCKKNPDNIFKNVPSISSRKESCEFCGKLLIIGNIKLHNNTCKQNPKNM